MESRGGSKSELVPDQTTEVGVIHDRRPGVSDQITNVVPQADDDVLMSRPSGMTVSAVRMPRRPYSTGNIEASTTHVTHDTAVVHIADFEIRAGMTLDQFQIQGKLGEGGMGTVFSAIHPMIGKRAAIKVLKRQFCEDPGTVDRFVDEARIVNQIGHPNIVDIFAFGEMPDGRRFFAMEWLTGETLRERLRRGPMSLTQMAHTIRSLARALEAAHDKDVIHRDLKPENIFLADIAHQEPLVKLLDFGVAKLANDKRRMAQTEKGQLLGTPMYIAPEQASNANDVGFASDIYSLGVIAFECLTGRPPFLAKNTVEMVTAHITEQPVAPSSLIPDIPDEIDTLVLEMLAKDPRQRPTLSHVRGLLELVRDASEAFEQPRTITTRARPDNPHAANPKTDPFGRQLTPVPRDDPFNVRFSSGVHQPLQRDTPSGPIPMPPQRPVQRERLPWIILISVVVSLAVLFATGIITV